MKNKMNKVFNKKIISEIIVFIITLIFVIIFSKLLSKPLSQYLSCLIIIIGIICLVIIDQFLLKERLNKYHQHENAVVSIQNKPFLIMGDKNSENGDYYQVFLNEGYLYFNYLGCMIDGLLLNELNQEFNYDESNDKNYKIAIDDCENLKYLFTFQQINNFIGTTGQLSFNKKSINYNYEILYQEDEDIIKEFFKDCNIIFSRKKGINKDYKELPYNVYDENNLKKFSLLTGFFAVIITVLILQCTISPLSSPLIAKISFLLLIVFLLLETLLIYIYPRYLEFSFFNKTHDNQIKIEPLSPYVITLFLIISLNNMENKYYDSVFLLLYWLIGIAIGIAISLFIWHKWQKNKGYLKITLFLNMIFLCIALGAIIPSINYKLSYDNGMKVEYNITDKKEEDNKYYIYYQDDVEINKFYTSKEQYENVSIGDSIKGFKYQGALGSYYIIFEEK